MDVDRTSYEAIKRRCGNHCEAMVLAGGTAYTRCWSNPIEIHHMLTRSRGGKVLDAAGETNHLIALCHVHHLMAHEPGGHERGLMIDGYVTTGPDNAPVYQGSDPRLLHLREVEVSVLPEDASGDLDGP